MAENKILREMQTRAMTERPKQWMPPELLPEPDKQAGYAYRWIRVSTLNTADPRNDPGHGAPHEPTRRHDCNGHRQPGHIAQAPDHQGAEEVHQQKSPAQQHHGPSTPAPVNQEHDPQTNHHEQYATGSQPQAI